MHWQENNDIGGEECTSTVSQCTTVNHWSLLVNTLNIADAQLSMLTTIVVKVFVEVPVFL